jgi:hypothetical protein
MGNVDAETLAKLADAAGGDGGDGDGDGGGGGGGTVSHERQTEALRRRIAAAESRIAEATPGFEETEGHADAFRQALAEKQAFNERVVDETEKLNEAEVGVFNFRFVNCC